jgi:hypothetical protein
VDAAGQAGDARAPDPTQHELPAVARNGRRGPVRDRGERDRDRLGQLGGERLPPRAQHQREAALAGALRAQERRRGLDLFRLATALPGRLWPCRIEARSRWPAAGCRASDPARGSRPGGHGRLPLP